MLIVELNIAGHRFSREVSKPHRTSLRRMRFRPRAMHWQIPQLRQLHTA
jgi:hypothetical protein